RGPKRDSMARHEDRGAGAEFDEYPVADPHPWGNARGVPVQDRHDPGAAGLLGTRNPLLPRNRPSELAAGHHRKSAIRRHSMRKWVIAVLAFAASAATAHAQSIDAGENSFKKCVVCHSIGEGATNKVGPALNGLEGRRS